MTSEWLVWRKAVHLAHKLQGGSPVNSSYQAAADSVFHRAAARLIEVSAAKWTRRDAGNSLDVTGEDLESAYFRTELMEVISDHRRGTGQLKIVEENDAAGDVVAVFDRGFPIWHEVMGLKFKTSDIFAAFGDGLADPAHTVVTPELTNQPEMNGQGRPKADWWPDFIAELVSYVVEVGIPDGVAHQGQGQVFKEVSTRMTARGKAEPSRAGCQEAINAVLRRLRSAGNT